MTTVDCVQLPVQQDDLPDGPEQGGHQAVEDHGQCDVTKVTSVHVTYSHIRTYAYKPKR